MTTPFDERVRESAAGRLDDRVVPRLQAATRRGVAAVGAPFLAAHRLEQRLVGGALYRLGWKRRRLVRTVVVLVALAGSFVHFERYPTVIEARQAARNEARQQTIRQPDAVADVAAGGVLHGPPLESRPDLWIEDRRAALAGLAPGEHLAIVSFEGYLAAADIRGRLPDEVLVLRAQYRIPDAAARPLETEVVGGDLETSVSRVVADERALIVDEEAALEELLASGTMGDPAFESDARTRLEELRATRNVLGATGAIVFAVVVRGDAAALQALGVAPGVRVVDPVPDAAVLEASVLLGIRPEDRTRVTFGVAP